MLVDHVQVCAGLRLFLTPEELKDKLVVAVCNLKPAKLAGAFLQLALHARLCFCCA